MSKPAFTIKIPQLPPRDPVAMDAKMRRSNKFDHKTKERSGAKSWRKYLED